MKNRLDYFRYGFDGENLFRESVFGDALYYEMLANNNEWIFADQYSQRLPAKWFNSITEAVLHEQARFNLRIARIEDLLNARGE